MKRIVLLLLSIILTVSCSIALAEEWVCPNCGKTNTTNFCTSCGTKHDVWICPNCGTENTDAYCGNCGTAHPVDTALLIGTWKYGITGHEQYMVFRNDGLLLAISPKGELAEGKYEATSDTIIVSSETAPTLSYKYKIVDDKLDLDLINGTYTRTTEPARFTYKMDGQSMADAVRDGDILTFECKDIEEFQRFDIITVNYPNRGDTVFVKRLIGFPGDTIELKDGYLYINGEKYTEEYINDDYRSGRLNSFGPYTVPEGLSFVLGDHRNNSNDSRSTGPIPSNMIIGVLIQQN